MAALSALDWPLRLLIGALVAGSVGTGVFLLVRTSGDGAESPQVVATMPLETATATATALPRATPTTPAPLATEEPVPTKGLPQPTADTRIPIRELPTVDQIQLGGDGRYFIADRGDGCRWDERLRLDVSSVGEEVIFGTDCQADFQFVYRPDTRDVILELP